MIEIDSFGSGLLGALFGALLVLVAVFWFAISLGVAAWRWARRHASTFEQFQANAKAGKIQLTATIEDRRVTTPGPKGAEIVNLDERREAGS